MGVTTVTSVDLCNVHKRIGHIAVAYKHYVLVWGGSSSVGSVTYYPADEVWMFNTISELWSCVLTSGKCPEFRKSGCTGLVLGDYLYIYGGVAELNEGYGRYSNKIDKLNLITHSWEDISPSGPEPEACDKGAGWTYRNKLYFFGGYGRRPLRPDFTYTFQIDITDSSGLRGWNNNLVSYDPETNTWSSPNTKGIPPAPRAAHACDIDGHLVFIFGGRTGNVRNNDLHYLDMETMTWSQNLTLGRSRDSVPEGRSWHSFNFVSPGRAILYGGLQQYELPSMDRWECRIGEDIVWTKHPEQIGPLVWHKAALSPVTGELIIIGGILGSPYKIGEIDHVDEMISLEIQPISLFRLCLRIITTDLTVRADVSCLPKLLQNLVLARVAQV